MKTYSPKPTDVKRKWFVIDAMEAPLGRLATHIATLLMGKSKPLFAKHIDCGDYVIVINANSVVTTGDKPTKKTYYSHSGYPGGLKQTSLKKQLVDDPTYVIMHAVRGMVPANKLRDDRLARLKIYPTEVHNHEAQKPERISMKEGK